jgi:hypothetical protein
MPKLLETFFNYWAVDFDIFTVLVKTVLQNEQMPPLKENRDT